MISGPFFVLAGCLCVMAQMFVWWDIAKANHMDRGSIGSGKCLHQLGRKRVFGKACTVNYSLETTPTLRVWSEGKLEVTKDKIKVSA